MSKQRQNKSGTAKPRAASVVPLHSTVLGRRIMALEKRNLELEGQRTMLVRAIGALAVAHAAAVGDTHEEPAILIPFEDMNVARDIGFAIDKEGPTPGFVVAIAKPLNPEQKIDSQAEVVAMVDAEERENAEREADIERQHAEERARAERES